MFIKKLYKLKKFLEKEKLSVECNFLNRFIKISSLPGIHFPMEEVEISGVNSAIKYIKDNIGSFIYLDNPAGSYKRFGQKEKRMMPFHYGEFPEISNPADNMGWDVIIVPSSCHLSETIDDSGETFEYVPSGNSLTPVGYVPVNSNQDLWTEKTKTSENPYGKKAPAGNDKIILADNSLFSEEDMNEIDSFFDTMWNFKKTVWILEPNKGTQK